MASRETSVINAFPTEPETLFEQHGCAGIITLNRPRQLNALTHGMVQAIYPQLLAWRDDTTITRIMIKGAGKKAFCAGGDIRALYDLGKAGRIAEARPFWREEYTLNQLLKTFPKPVVSLLNGIVMGGGVGMSFHGSHRVASQKLMFAMPEVGIGFFPDVGASWFLPRLPNHVGAYLALTGARIGLGDASALGLVTHAVESTRMAELAQALCGEGDVNSILAEFTVTPPVAPLLEHHAMISEVFSEHDLSLIFAKLSYLAIGGSVFAGETLETMQLKSPTSMVIALEQMRRGISMTFAEAMQMEYRIVSRIAEGHDFYEGVRAVIIDKDNEPQWRPVRMADLTKAAIDAHFAPLADDLVLDSVGVE
jgi:enoyl-CoA hydratase